MTVRQSKAGIGNLFCGTAAACFAAFILRIAAQCIDTAAVGELQFYIGGRVCFGILGAQHGRIPAVTAGRAEKRKGNGIKNGRLAGTGIAGDQIKSRFTQLCEVQFLHTGIRAKACNG